MSFRPRVIPILQLSGKGLVKTIGFGNPVYVGDPINAVRIFNDFRADELVLIDIEASVKNRPIQFDLIKRIAEEAYMPLSYGGGVNSIENAAKLIQTGVEKLILGTALHRDLNLVSEIAARFGSQAVLASVDVKKEDDKYCVFYQSGTQRSGVEILDFMNHLVHEGVGEILLQFIETDGTEKGVDQAFVKTVAEKIPVPLIVAGGIASLEEMKSLTTDAGASAAAAGSLFTFLGSRNSVLINYPDANELKSVFEC